jgi:hypothetical protein
MARGDAGAGQVRHRLKAGTLLPANFRVENESVESSHRAPRAHDYRRPSSVSDEFAVILFAGRFFAYCD